MAQRVQVVDADDHTTKTSEDPGRNAWMSYCSGLRHLAWVLIAAKRPQVQAWAIDHAMSKRLADQRLEDGRPWAWWESRREMLRPPLPQDLALARRMADQVMQHRDWILSVFEGIDPQEIITLIASGRAPGVVLGLIDARGLPPGLSTEGRRYAEGIRRAITSRMRLPAHDVA